MKVQPNEEAQRVEAQKRIEQADGQKIDAQHAEAKRIDATKESERLAASANQFHQGLTSGQQQAHATQQVTNAEPTVTLRNHLRDMETKVRA